MALNGAEFERRSEDFFAASYLASLGVIQNVVLGLLAAKVFATTSSDTSLLWLQAIGSFIVIVLIVEEYHWWLLLVRRTPTFLDATIPYVLGAIELAAVAAVDDTEGRWFLRMGILGLLGILALFNSRLYCTPDLFRECLWLRPRALRNLTIGMALVGGMTIVLFTTWLLWNRMPKWTQWTSLLLFYALASTMIAVSTLFLRSAKREFERLAASA